MLSKYLCSDQYLKILLRNKTLFSFNNFVTGSFSSANVKRD